MIFITYEDPESIRHKCEFIKNQNLAGAMFWEYHADADAELLNAINTGLK
jgi:chitinase